MSVYYNENDPKAAAWLRELIKQGHLPAGVVDDRSIEDVKPGELKGFTHCHFFAGIGGWAYALALASWPDSRPVWTGSCPCQPFSVANSRRKDTDARHLYPVWSRLIEECEPSVVFGEQVASPLGLAWLDSVCADLEAKGYAVGAADLCAAGVGAPHIRQRLYWVAHSERARANSRRLAIESREGFGAADAGASAESGRRGDVGCWSYPECPCGWREEPACVGVGNASGAGGRGHAGAVLEAQGGVERGVRSLTHESQSAGADSVVADANGEGPQGRGVGRLSADQRSPWSSSMVGWIPCRDGKWRPAESGSFPLAHGVPGRVGLLRGYGNAIVPQVAATFIEASGVI